MAAGLLDRVAPFFRVQLTTKTAGDRCGEVAAAPSLRKKSGMVVRHPSGHPKDDGDQPPSEHLNSRGPAKKAGIFVGLCANCANRETCLIPKSEGGVWHCEEYVEDR